MECFVGEHAPLAVSAILILIFCLLVVVLMTAIVMEKIKVCNNLARYVFILAYMNILFKTVGNFTVRYS